MNRAILIAAGAGFWVAGVVLVHQGLQVLAPSGGAPSAQGPATAPSPPASRPDAGQPPAEDHEKAGALAAARIRILIADRDYQKAADLARQSMREYHDTTAAKDLPGLLAAAEDGLAVLREQRVKLAVREEQHQRFLKFRADGNEAIARNDLAAAIQFLRSALDEEEDAETRAQLEDLIDRSGKPKLGVPDFAIRGETGIMEPGRTVAQLVLVQFPTDKFQLLEPAQVAACLAEKDLTAAQVAEDPQLLKERKVRGVRFIVLGTVSRAERLAVTARLVDVTTGQVVQTADVSADTPSALLDALKDLAAVLQMTPQEKEEHLRSRAQREEARAAQEREARAQPARRGGLESLQLREAHEKKARDVLEQINEAIRRQDLQRAHELAVRGAEEFADTPSAESFAWQVKETARQIAARRQYEAEQRAIWAQHCRDAAANLAGAKVLMARGEYDRTIRMCLDCLRDYGDTPTVPEFRRLLEEARKLAKPPPPPPTPPTAPAGNKPPSLAVSDS